jgi:hypothetical protein
MSAPALKSKQYWGQPLRQALLFCKTPDMHVSYAVDKATTVDNTTNQRSRLPTPNASAGRFNLYPVPAACLLYWLAAF